MTNMFSGAGRSRRGVLLSSAGAVSLLSALGAGGAAIAQDDDTTAAVGDEITVYGRFQNSLVNRLPISIDELPYSLDVIDQEFIKDRGFIRPLEALQTIPNVVIADDQFSSGAPSFLIRGYNASILVNNRPEGTSRGFGAREASFVERYEVLKGPASISLGPVLPGGIINTVTKLPEAEPFLGFEFRAGSFGTFRSEIDANTGPLFNSDAVRGRITLAYENAEFANGIENRRVFAVRPVFEVDISPRTISNFSVGLKDYDAVPGLNFAIFQDGTIPEGFDNETYFGPRSNVSAEGRDVLVDGEIQHQFLDNLKLTLRGSYQDTDLDYANSQGLYNYNFDEGQFGIAPSNPVGNFYASTGSFDEEVVYLDAQLALNTNVLGSGVDVVVGGTFQETNGLSTFGFDGFNAIISVLDADFESLPIPVNTVEPTPFFDFTDELYSVYGEMIIRPFDWLTIPVGVRYDNLTNEIRDPTSGGDDLAEDDFVQVTRETFEDVSFRIGATAEVTDTINVYASFAESFIPQSGVVRGGGPVGPETARSFELGAKLRLFNDGLRITTALFNTVRDNVAGRDPSNRIVEIDGELVQENFVVGDTEQRHRGFEVSANGNITDAWDANISYGFLDAEITASSEPIVGLQATVAPDHTFSAFSSYTFEPQGPFNSFRVGGGVRYLSRRPGSIGSDLTFDGYTLVDMFASYELTDQFNIQLNANNLLDKEYIESAGNDGRTAGGFDFGEPRVILVTLKGRI
ncbi:MAG: TonB-dependent receptor [Pseudomonadota bacterium]